MLFPALALALAAPVGAEASRQMNVDDLLILCGQDQPGEACRFYILGAVEGVSLAAEAANDHSRFCVPSNVTQAALVDNVRRLARADVIIYPEDRTTPAVTFIGAALIRTYPCH